MCLFVLTIWRSRSGRLDVASISGLVVEYIVAIDVTRVRFPADALQALHGVAPLLPGWWLGGAVAHRSLGRHIRYSLAG